MSQTVILAPELEGYESSTFDFEATVREQGLSLEPVSIETLQVNITKLCNQACLHCHVDAGPKRTEQMDLATVERCLEILQERDSIKNLDITGGAPELSPYFDYMVIEARKMGKHVMVRHNLTVTWDGNPRTGEQKM
jgi:2-iminoacetate synthase ThiH